MPIKNEEMCREETLKNNKLLSMVGFAMRAGRLVCGTDHICDEVRRHGFPDDGEPNLPTPMGIVLLTADASDNTKKRIANACNYYRIPLIRTTITSEQLGERIGKPPSAACATFDRGFADGIRKAAGLKADKKRSRS